ncbi:MAG: DivIVA domain-containing protein [Acidobacteria bacterium]|nr:DivIVA domain-containing protein [Acidobacteriota bacterium]
MDLTTDRFAEVVFEERRRGYDPVEVDRFLEEIEAGVGALQGKVARLKQRVIDAEAAGSKASETEETLRRTLVLAQRTADAVVEEAKNESAQIVSDATESAATLTADAEEQSATIREMAESEARRVAEATRGPVLDEIRDLEEIRNFLMDDVELLETHVATERERIERAVGSIQAALSDPEPLRVARAPQLSGVSLGSGPVIAPEDDQGIAEVSAVPEDEHTQAIDVVEPQEVSDQTEQHEAVENDSGDEFFDELRRAVNDGDDYGEASLLFEDEDDEQHIQS